MYYRSGKIRFYCYSLESNNSSISYLCTAMIHKPFCSTIAQRMMIRMCKHTHGHHRMVKETNETIDFQARFFYYTFL